MFAELIQDWTCDSVSSQSTPPTPPLAVHLPLCLGPRTIKRLKTLQSKGLCLTPGARGGQHLRRRGWKVPGKNNLRIGSGERVVGGTPIGFIAKLSFDVSRRMEIILNANFSLSSAAVKIRTLSAEGFKEIQVEPIRIRQGS